MTPNDTSERSDGIPGAVPGRLDAATRLSDSRRGVLRTAAAASVVAGLGLPAVGSAGAREGATQESAAAVEIPNQTTDGTTVTVEDVTVDDGGYVAIHDTSLFEGEVIPSVIGVSDFLEPGSYDVVEVDLFDVRGGDFDQDALEEDQPLVAMPHEETNDNETYDFVATEGEEDGPYVLAGQPVVDVGFVAVGPTADVTFQNQETDGTSVTVDAVTLSDGGFVVIHDLSLFDGEVIPSVIGVSDALEAGESEDVTVDLFDVPGQDFDQDALEGTQPLVAMPHLDTNDNGEYDFVETDGEEDGPYTADGNAVVDLAFAVVDSG